MGTVTRLTENRVPLTNTSVLDPGTDRARTRVTFSLPVGDSTDFQFSGLDGLMTTIGVNTVPATYELVRDTADPDMWTMTFNGVVTIPDGAYVERRTNPFMDTKLDSTTEPAVLSAQMSIVEDNLERLSRGLNDSQIDLERERTDRGEDEKVITDRIDGHDTDISGLGDRIDDEITDREAGDTALGDRIDNLRITDVAGTKISPERKFGPYRPVVSDSMSRTEWTPSTTPILLDLVGSSSAPISVDKGIIAGRLFHEFWSGALEVTVKSGAGSGNPEFVFERGFTHIIGTKSFTTWRKVILPNVKAGDHLTLPLSAFNSHTPVMAGDITVDANGNIDPMGSTTITLTEEELAGPSKFHIQLRVTDTESGNPARTISKLEMSQASVVFFQLEDGVMVATPEDIADLQGDIGTNRTLIEQEIADRKEAIENLDLTVDTDDGTINLGGLVDRVVAVETQLGDDEDDTETVEAAIERLDTDKADTSAIPDISGKADQSALNTEIQDRKDADIADRAYTDRVAAVKADKSQLGNKGDSRSMDTTEGRIENVRYYARLGILELSNNDDDALWATLRLDEQAGDISTGLKFYLNNAGLTHNGKVIRRNGTAFAAPHSFDKYWDVILDSTSGDGGDDGIGTQLLFADIDDSAGVVVLDANDTSNSYSGAAGGELTLSIRVGGPTGDASSVTFTGPGPSTVSHTLYTIAVDIPPSIGPTDSGTNLNVRRIYKARGDKGEDGTGTGGGGTDTTARSDIADLKAQIGTDADTNQTLEAGVSALKTIQTTQSSQLQSLAQKDIAIDGRLNNGATGLNALSNRISTETTHRTNADTALGTRIDAVEAKNTSQDTAIGLKEDKTVVASLTGRVQALEDGGGSSDVDFSTTVRSVDEFPDANERKEGEAIREQSSGDIADVVDGGNRDFPFTAKGETVTLSGRLSGEYKGTSQATHQHSDAPHAGEAIHIPQKSNGANTVTAIGLFTNGNSWRVELPRFPYVTVRNRMVGGELDTALETGVDALTAVVKATLPEEVLSVVALDTGVLEEPGQTAPLLPPDPANTLADNPYFGVHPIAVSMSIKQRTYIRLRLTNLYVSDFDGETSVTIGVTLRAQTPGSNIRVIDSSPTVTATPADNPRTSLDWTSDPIELEAGDVVSLGLVSGFHVTIESASIEALSPEETKSMVYTTRYSGIEQEYFEKGEEQTVYAQNFGAVSDPLLDFWNEIIDDGLEYDFNLFVGSEAADRLNQPGLTTTPGGAAPKLINNSVVRYFQIADFAGINFSVKDGYIISDKSVSVSITLTATAGTLSFAGLMPVANRAPGSPVVLTTSNNVATGTVTLAADTTYLIYTTATGVTATVEITAGSGKQIYTFEGAQQKNYQRKDTTLTRENTKQISVINNQLNHITETVESLRNQRPGLVGDDRVVDRIVESEITDLSELPVPTADSPERVRLAEGYHTGEHIETQETIFGSPADYERAVSSGFTGAVLQPEYGLGFAGETYELGDADTKVEIAEVVPHTRVTIRRMASVDGQGNDADMMVKATIRLNGDAYRERTFNPNTAVHEAGDSQGSAELVKGDVAMGVLTDLKVGDELDVLLEVVTAPTTHATLDIGVLELVGSNTKSILGLNEVPGFTFDDNWTTATVLAIDGVTAAGTNAFPFKFDNDVSSDYAGKMEGGIWTSPETVMEMNAILSAPATTSNNARYVFEVQKLDDSGAGTTVATSVRQGESFVRLTNTKFRYSTGTEETLTLSWTTEPNTRYIVVAIPSRTQDAGILTHMDDIRLHGVYNVYPFLGTQEHNYDGSSLLLSTAYILETSVLTASPRYFNYSASSATNDLILLEPSQDASIQVQLGNINNPTGGAVSVTFSVVATIRDLTTTTTVVSKTVALTNDNRTDTSLEFQAVKGSFYYITTDDSRIVTIGNIKITARNPQFPNGYPAGLLRPNNERQPADLYKKVRLTAPNTMTATYNSVTVNGRKYSGFSIGHLVGNSYPDVGRVTTMWGPGGPQTHVDFIASDGTRLGFISVDINRFDDLKREINMKKFFNSGGILETSLHTEVGGAVNAINPERFDSVHLVSPEFHASDTPKDGSFSAGAVAYNAVSMTTVVAGTTLRWLETLPSDRSKLEQYDGKVTDFRVVVSDDSTLGFHPYDYAYVPQSAYDTDTNHHMTVQLAHIAQLLQQYKEKINELAAATNGVDPLT